MNGDTYELHRLAQEYLDAGNPREAVATLDYAMREAPGDRALRRLQARALFDFAALGRAESVLRSLLDAEPTDPELLILLARVLRRTGRAADSVVVEKVLAAMGVDPATGTAAA
ncbi:MAG: hypothetical protein QOD70_2886 [Frankiales bacterium]|jgi:predicted Zn-dependent protease|nr:hypothetical protein [Frankiales bacterium]